MQVTGSNNSISVQVSLNGFSINNGCARSEWLGADRVFTSPELQGRFDKVELSTFTTKFTLVPEQFFSPEGAREILSEVVTLSENDVVESVALARYGAVAVYSVSGTGTLGRVLSDMLLHVDGTKARLLPEQYYMMENLDEISDYNKIVASYADGYLYLAVAQGRTLLLCNSFEASDFTTAQYFIFMVMRRFQLNPEVSTIYFRTPLSAEEEESLYAYFKSVEVL
ncbi:MAG: DUF3822 family protein [Bacteroidales bacterium]|nr:DUF3822 family protein [Bacteroidales bacterium]